MSGNYGRAFGFGFMSVVLSTIASYMAGISCVFFAVLANDENARDLPKRLLFLRKPTSSAILSVILAFSSGTCFAIGVLFFLLGYSSILRDISLPCLLVASCSFVLQAFGLLVALYKSASVSLFSPRSRSTS